MTDDEIIEVVKAHKEGKTIQCKPFNPTFTMGSDWFDAGPFWDFAHYDYRVAPEPRKPREWKLGINGEYEWICKGDAVNFQAEEIVRVREVLENE